MATISQLVRKPRKDKVQKTNVPALEACPQKRGVCTRVYSTVSLCKPTIEHSRWYR